MKTTLRFFKNHLSAKDPVFSTRQSSCFDLHASLPNDEHVKWRCHDVDEVMVVKDSKIVIHPEERWLVPTGLIFDIPEGWSMRLHPRSGLAYKQGLVLANCEGVIDSDYVEPVYMMMMTYGKDPVEIYDGERICQGELVRDEFYEFKQTSRRPMRKTDRDGGIGSTGV